MKILKYGTQEEIYCLIWVKLEEAIKSFDRALEVCFDDSELDAGSINRMGNAYIDLGKLDEALDVSIQLFL